MDTCFVYVSSLNFKEGEDDNKKESNNSNVKNIKSSNPKILLFRYRLQSTV